MPCHRVLNIVTDGGNFFVALSWSCISLFFEFISNSSQRLNLTKNSLNIYIYIYIYIYLCVCVWNVFGCTHLFQIKMNIFDIKCIYFIVIYGTNMLFLAYQHVICLQNAYMSYVYLKLTLYIYTHSQTKRRIWEKFWLLKDNYSFWSYKNIICI